MHKVNNDEQKKYRHKIPVNQQNPAPAISNTFDHVNIRVDNIIKNTNDIQTRHNLNEMKCHTLLKASTRALKVKY